MTKPSISVLYGLRKLLVVLLALSGLGILVGITVLFVTLEYVNGVQYTTIVISLGNTLATIAVAYLGVNVGKHLLDTGRTCIADWRASKGEE